MAKSRPTVPRAVRDEVLDAFNHRCAICGGDHPHLHHIDENPTNNIPLNLLPLCPNCHLTDQHNPTRHHEVGILSLFRRYKDPSILKPQFAPLYERTRFLLADDEATFDVDAFLDSTRKLFGFVSNLSLGSYYWNELVPLLTMPKSALTMPTTNNAQQAFDESARRQRSAYFQTIRTNRTEIFRLIVELLRYQNWR